jgi:hypothetical protein
MAVALRRPSNATLSAFTTVHHCQCHQRHHLLSAKAAATNDTMIATADSTTYGEAACCRCCRAVFIIIMLLSSLLSLSSLSLLSLSLLSSSLSSFLGGPANLFPLFLLAGNFFSVLAFRLFWRETLCFKPPST